MLTAIRPNKAAIPAKVAGPLPPSPRLRRTPTRALLQAQAGTTTTTMPPETVDRVKLREGLRQGNSLAEALICGSEQRGLCDAETSFGGKGKVVALDMG